MRLSGNRLCQQPSIVELVMTYNGLIEHVVGCEPRSFERRIWILAPTFDPPLAAIIFLDGELYLEKVTAPVVVGDLQQRHTIPSALVVFVPSNGAAARHRDFVCSSDYAAYLATELVDFIRQKYPTVSELVIAGLSLSGLMAAYAATRHPRVFWAAICQSPSLWWDRSRFAEDLPVAVRPGQKLWICVGSRETESGICHPPSGLRQEMSQVAGCTLAVAALRAKGYSVHYREYDGGHDFDCWREDLALALPWVWRDA
jgi:enterochelin esterase family protein